MDPTEHVNRSTSNASTLAALQQVANAHLATFTAPVPQLPAAREAFLGPVLSSTSQLTGTTATFQFTRPKDSLNDHYILQSGTDLTGWTDLAIDPFLTVTPGPGDTETVEVTVPLETLSGQAPTFFVRLKSVRP